MLEPEILICSPTTRFDQALEDARFSTVFSHSHPLAVLRPALAGDGLKSAAELDQCEHRSWVKLAGLTISVNTPPTRNGRRAMFVTMEDETGIMDIAVFGRLQQTGAQTIMTSRMLGLEGFLHRAGPQGRAISVNAHRLLRPWTGSLVKILEREKGRSMNRR